MNRKNVNYVAGNGYNHNYNVITKTTNNIICVHNVNVNIVAVNKINYTEVVNIV